LHLACIFGCKIHSACGDAEDSSYGQPTFYIL
jgi:hypothetical protein